MEAINSVIVFEDTHVASKEEYVSSVDKESKEWFMDYYDEPGNFFRGALFGLILCLPFWAFIFWFIT
jgi:hypothetical protein